MPVEVSAIRKEAFAQFLVFPATPWTHGPVGDTRIQEAENSIGVMSKGSKPKHRYKHERF